MKQLLQNLKTGETQFIDVPVPQCRSGRLLIQTHCSLISAGTERMLVEFGQANLLAKAKAQPEKVRQVLDKMRTDGALATLGAVRNKLDQPIPLGYCNAGVVLEVGDGVKGFDVGDRVVSNGSHAEAVCVPKNLCAKIPDTVSDDEAAFTVLAAVGLQGIRLAKPTLGENVAVIGLGLVGLLTTQMLIANGCRVIGFDLDENRVNLARQFGAEAYNLNNVDPVSAAMTFSNEHGGVDAVLITASTKSSDPVHQAALMSRKRGRIVLVGVTGLDLKRSDFYEKELTFQVSCSYGPGRYDPEYEQKGHDYPYGFVRWTEQRNFEAVLDLMVHGKLNVRSLISQHVPLEQAPDVFKTLAKDRSNLGIIITYPETPDFHNVVTVNTGQSQVGHLRSTNKVVVGVIGAGNFASMVLLPALKKAHADLRMIAASGGTSASIAARKFGFEKASSDYQEILNNQDINTVFILTRHDTHAKFVIEALKAGKHVFVEKPLAPNESELREIIETYHSVLGTQSSALSLMVGFNRRFAPLAVKMKELVKHRTQPITAVYMVNAGTIPPDHWTQDPAVGGGRIIGEGCHFVDFLRFLIGYPITEVVARRMGSASGVGISEDKMSILLTFADGSLGTLHYFANGSKRFPKERVEVFSEGRILVLDNFKSLRGYGWKGFKQQHLFRQDKGHEAEVAAFVKRVREGGEPLIPFEELVEVTRATFEAVKSAGSTNYTNGH